MIVAHPVHVTITSIERAGESDSLRVFFRMYYDDFLLDQYEPGRAGDTEKEICTSRLNDLSGKYFNNKINIFINNKRVTGKLLNTTLDNNELSMNLLFPADRNLRKISVINRVLINIYADQSNLTIIKIGDFEEGIRLTPAITEYSFRIKRHM